LLKKTVHAVKIGKSFRPPFSKWREPSAEGEIFLSALFFLIGNSRSDLRRACEPLSFCAYMVKRKSGYGVFAISRKRGLIIE